MDGAQWVSVRSEQEVLALVQACSARRAVAATDMNARSSRSHSILTLEVSSSLQHDAAGTGGTLFAKLNLVDLAGSESVRVTGAAGARLKEGAAINRSLLTLSRIISMVSTGATSGFIPFRESRLTHLLEPSLRGQCRTAVICCMSPAPAYVEESRSTLQFATSAKAITTRATRTEVVDDSTRIARMAKEIAALKSQLAAATSDSASTGTGGGHNEEQKHRLATLLQELIVGGGTHAASAGGAPPLQPATARGRTVLDVARLNQRGRVGRARETWCPSMASDSAAVAALEAFRAPARQTGGSPAHASFHSGSSPLHSPGVRSSVSASRLSSGGCSTASGMSSASTASAGTVDEDGALQMELHTARAEAAALRAEAAATAEHLERLLAAEEEAEDTIQELKRSLLAAETAAEGAGELREALDVALGRAEAAEAASAALQQQVATAAASVEAAEEEADAWRRRAEAAESAAARRVEDSAATAAAHRRRVAELEQQVAALSDALSTSQASLSTAQARVAKLDKVKMTRAHLDTMARLKADKQRYKALAKQLQEQLEDAAAGAAASPDVAALQAQTAAAEEAGAAAAAEAEAAAEEAAAAARRADAATAEAAAVRGEMESQTAALAALQVEVAALVAAAGGAAQHGLDTGGLPKDAATSVDSATRGVRAASALCGALLKRLQDAAAEKDSNTARLVRLAQAGRAADAAVEAAQARAKEAAAEAEQARATAADLTQQLADMQQVQADAAKAVAAAEAATAEAASAAEAVTAAEAATAAAEARATAAEEAAAAARAALQEAKADARRSGEILERENVQLLIELRSVRAQAAAAAATAQAPAPAPPAPAPAPSGKAVLTPVQPNTPVAPVSSHKAPPLQGAGVGEEEEAGECQQQ